MVDEYSNTFIVLFKTFITLPYLILFLQEHLKKVTEQFSDDVEAWIELAGILEQSDVQVINQFSKHLISSFSASLHNCMISEMQEET